jgi:hypothetical protein
MTPDEWIFVRGKVQCMEKGDTFIRKVIQKNQDEDKLYIGRRKIFPHEKLVSLIVQPICTHNTLGNTVLPGYMLYLPKLPS